MAKTEKGAAPVKPIDEQTTAEPKVVLRPLSQQTLGEIAYNTYCGARGWKAMDGTKLPEFRQQDQALRDAWEKAGNKVAAVVESDEYFTTEEGSVYKNLVREKIAAGLTPDQAADVARREVESQKRAKSETAKA